MTNSKIAKPDCVSRHVPAFAPAAAALGWLLGLLAPGPHGLCRANGASPGEISETFAGDTFDRTRWWFDRRSPPGVRVELGGEILHVVVPPGAAGRPAASLRAQFAVEGDFDIRAEYEIKALPRPPKEWSNIEIFISGPDGAAAVIRTNHAVAGDGYSLWFEPSSGKGTGGAWKHMSTHDDAGTLRLERIGQELRFWAAARGGKMKMIGAVPLGDGPIRQVEVRGIAPATRSALDYRVDNISVRADRLIEPPKPADSLIGRGAWKIMAIFPLGAAVLWAWQRRARR
jgi:hypothetical protein